MKKLLITLLLALAVCAGAVELYWDEEEHFHGGTTSASFLGVLFSDYGEGPGNNGGLEGTVYAFRVFYKTMSEEPASLYLYSPKWSFERGYIPDEPLHDRELEYEETQEGDWTVYTLVESFDVPSGFFAVLGVPANAKVYYADGFRRERHSARYFSGGWHPEHDDNRIRVEWEPLVVGEETAVVEASWGAIKAGI